MILPDDERRRIAWQYTTIVDGYDPNMYRKDSCGAWIRWDMYGRQDNIFGWEVDHIYPQQRGGDDNPKNLRALQHQNNASKGNDYPSYEAVVIAQNNTNIESHQNLIVNEAKRKELAQIYSIK